MISEDRLEELIAHHESNIKSMGEVARMFGMGNPLMDVTHKVAVQLTLDTIKALKEYRDMAAVKGMIEG